MSLQELRNTLFNYIGQRLYQPLKASEYTDHAQWGSPWDELHDPEAVGSDEIKSVGSFTEFSFDTHDGAKGPYDYVIRDLLGGNRGTECKHNVEGPCTYEFTNIYTGRRYILNVAPAYEFELYGEDPEFLGGWLLDDAPFGQHYNSLLTERDEFEVENTELQAALSEAQAAAADIKVFPFVNWTRANKSKAWYKDVDWSAIPFNHLNEDEKEKLDWSKINYAEANNNDSFDPALIDWSDISGAKKAHQIKAYKTIDWASVDFTALDEGDRESIDWTKVNYAKAQASEEFDIFSLDWDFLNQLSTQPKKKVYQKIAWNEIDFSVGDSSVFDWSTINIKKAMASDDFTLDAVDIDETKQTKNFKRLSAALKKSSADELLGGASDETLLEIGYENFVGKIGDPLIQDFTTTSRKYSLILKPLSYARASAVATAMGGSLAPQATGDSYDYELVDEIQFLASNQRIARKMFNSQVDDRSLAWFEAQSGEDDQRTYSALDLQSFDQYSGSEEISLSSDSKLWFVIDRGAATVFAAPIGLMPNQGQHEDGHTNPEDIISAHHYNDL